jgi:lipopolysaccharide biosynthesis glycosyltransferase
LEPIWNIDISDVYVAAANNIHDPFTREPYYTRMGDYSYKSLGYDESLHVFNSGVMVMNLNKCRADELTRNVIAITKEVCENISIDNPHTLKFIEYDEYGLNLVVRDKRIILDEKWNVLPESKVNTPYIIHTLH